VNLSDLLHQSINHHRWVDILAANRE